MANQKFSSYDFILAVYGTTADTYTFYNGGTSGTIVGTTTLVYADTAKTTFVQVIKQ